MITIFLELAIAVGVAVVLSFAMKALRQPAIIAYILTGVIVGPSLLSLVGPESGLEIFASLGVAFLLFIVGLGLDPNMIKDVGKVSVATGLAQIVFTSLFGFLIGILLGFDWISSLYAAVAFTFSSTIIILRLLYEKEEHDSLYGRISIGFLLVQDLVAMLIFVFLASSGAAAQGGIIMTVMIVGAKLFSIALITVLLWRYVIPVVDRMIEDDRQLQFIFAIALCFGFAWLFQFLGFSLELGTLVAGLLLSTSPFHRELAGRIQPLRDFFLVIFFISLGIHMTFASVWSQLVPIILFSLFILVGNPLVVLFIMTKMGHTRKTAFLSGLTVAQISEFSLIMLGIGITYGHIGPDILALGTAVGLITIAGSSYMILHNKRLYDALEPFLRRITPYAVERESGKDLQKETFEMLVLGAHRLGTGIIEAAQEKGTSLLVIDFDPFVIERLKSKGVNAIFGSAEDPQLLDQLNFKKTKLIISTIPDIDTNSFLIDYIKRVNSKTDVICLANHLQHAERLYREGALYVIMPFYLSRQFMVDMFDEYAFSKTKYAAERRKHIKQLQYMEHKH